MTAATQNINVKYIIGAMVCVCVLYLLFLAGRIYAIVAGNSSAHTNPSVNAVVEGRTTNTRGVAGTAELSANKEGRQEGAQGDQSDELEWDAEAPKAKGVSRPYQADVADEGKEEEDGSSKGVADSVISILSEAEEKQRAKQERIQRAREEKRKKKEQAEKAALAELRKSERRRRVTENKEKRKEADEEKRKIELEESMRAEKRLHETRRKVDPQTAAMVEAGLMEKRRKRQEAAFKKRAEKEATKAAQA